MAVWKKWLTASAAILLLILGGGGTYFYTTDQSPMGLLRGDGVRLRIQGGGNRIKVNAAPPEEPGEAWWDEVSWYEPVVTYGPVYTGWDTGGADAELNGANLQDAVEAVEADGTGKTIILRDGVEYRVSGTIGLKLIGVFPANRPATIVSQCIYERDGGPEPAHYSGNSAGKPTYTARITANTHLAKITSVQNGVPGNGNTKPTIWVTNGAAYWNLRGFAVETAVTNQDYGTVLIGYAPTGPYPTVETNVDEIANHLLLDRLWIKPPTTHRFTNSWGGAGNYGTLAVIEVSDLHAVGLHIEKYDVGSDYTCITANWGLRVTVRNSKIWGGSETFFVGGGGMSNIYSLPDTLPKFWRIQQNHIGKDHTQMKLDGWYSKTVVESKSSIYILFEGNIVEANQTEEGDNGQKYLLEFTPYPAPNPYTTWSAVTPYNAGQYVVYNPSGTARWFKALQPSTNEAPPDAASSTAYWEWFGIVQDSEVATIRHWVVRRNIFRNGWAWTILGGANREGIQFPTASLTYEDNLVYNMVKDLYLMAGGPGVDNVTMRRNTIEWRTNGLYYLWSWDDAGTPFDSMTGWVVEDNLIFGGQRIISHTAAWDTTKNTVWWNLALIAPTAGGNLWCPASGFNSWNNSTEFSDATIADYDGTIGVMDYNAYGDAQRVAIFGENWVNGDWRVANPLYRHGGAGRNGRSGDVGTNMTTLKNAIAPGDWDLPF